MQLTRLRVALQTPDTNASTSVSDCGEAEHCHRNLYNWTKQVIPSIGYFEESFMLPNNVFLSGKESTYSSTKCWVFIFTIDPVHVYIICNNDIYHAFTNVCGKKHNDWFFVGSQERPSCLPASATGAGASGRAARLLRQPSPLLNSCYCNAALT